MDRVVRCGVRELGDVLRVRMLGWFGQVVRREETEILGKTACCGAGATATWKT